MKNGIIKFGEWAQANWLALVIFLTVIMMCFLVMVLTSWLAGYWLKGIYGLSFDLSSCWQGVGAVCAGMASTGALAGVAWSKYHTDSKFNSPLGQNPRDILKKG